MRTSIVKTLALGASLGVIAYVITSIFAYAAKFSFDMPAGPALCFGFASVGMALYGFAALVGERA